MRKWKSILVCVLLLTATAGVVRIGKALDEPFPVYGYVKDSDGNAVSGAEVVVKDVSKSTQISVYTESNGYYQADLFDLQNCEDGDIIEVYCSYDNEDDSETFTLDVSQLSKEINLFLVGMPGVTTRNATSITSSSAKLNGELTDLGGINETCQVWFQYGKTTSYGYITTKITLSSLTNFSKTITGLKPDTTYHYRAVAKNSRKTAYGEDKTFHTPPTLPEVTTNDAGDVGYNSAKLNGYLNKPGASSCKVWFVYDVTSHSNWQDYEYSTPKITKTSSAAFSYTLSNLEVNKKYYFRAVASNSAGTVAGVEKTFTTHIILADVATIQAENITSNSAVLRGELIDMGGDDACQVWFEYGETTSYGYSTENISLSNETEFTIAVDNLSPGKEYHFRAVAKNEKGMSYGADKTFTTLAVKARVETSNVYYAIILRGNLTDMGGDDACQVWFEYWEEGKENERHQTEKRIMEQEGIFTEVITGLEENKTYYYRAVVNNSQGISYGANLSFKMFSLPAPPIIETLHANASYENATLYANVSSLGDSNFCYVWFEYWNGEKHATAPQKVNETGILNVSIEGLEDGEIYYYKAIAVGSNGRIAYGEERNFSTLQMQNHKPIIELLYPENGAVVDANISLMAQVYDEDNDIMNVTFHINGMTHSVISSNGIVSFAVSLEYGENYTWYVVAYDGRNESASDIYNFSTIQRIEARFNYSPANIFENEAVYFNDSSSGEIIQWLWIFGDGNISSEQNVSHIYKKAGIYKVNLTVTDIYGNSASTAEEIIVWKRGDANMDGKINAMDITKIERILHGIDDETPPADADGNGEVSQEDLEVVINKILGLT